MKSTDGDYRISKIDSYVDYYGMITGCYYSTFYSSEKLYCQYLGKVQVYVHIVPTSGKEAKVDGFRIYKV